MRALPHHAMRALIGSLMLTATMVACRTSAPTETPAPAPPTVPAGLADAEVAEVETPDDAPILLNASANGTRFALHEDGMLTRGAARGHVEIPSLDPYWLGEQASLREVDLGADVTVIVVELPLPDDEDPANRVQAFVREGDVLRKVWDWTPSGYGPVTLEFPGDGRVRYTEDGWTACIAAGHPKGAVPLMRVTLGLEGGVFVEVSREASGAVQRCDQLAG